MTTHAPAHDRRVQRAAAAHVALRYQLDACCARGVEAMIVADADGIPLAAAGDEFVCEEVAARIVIAGRRVDHFEGTLLGHGSRWDVAMKKIRVDGSELVLCAIGGTADSRKRQMLLGEQGAQRILAVAA